MRRCCECSIEETLCLELGNKDSLQMTYGNQALILQDWGRLEEAFELHKKQETLCLELGNKNSRSEERRVGKECA